MTATRSFNSSVEHNAKRSGVVPKTPIFGIHARLRIAKTGINNFEGCKCSMQRVILESVLGCKISVPEIHDKYWNSC